MSTSVTNIVDVTAVEVRCDAGFLHVRLSDGRALAVPLTWFPRLTAATSTQLVNTHLIGGGTGIHWPDLDEDLSIAGLLRGTRRL